MTTYDIEVEYDGNDELIVKIANPDGRIDYHDQLVKVLRPPHGEPSTMDFDLTVFVQEKPSSNVPFLIFKNTGFYKNGPNKGDLDIFCAVEKSGAEKKKKRRTVTGVHSGHGGALKM